MKKLIFFTGIIIYILFAISTFITVAKENKNTILEITPSSAVSVENNSEEYYILTVKDGVIVALNNKGKIIETTDTRISILPKADQQDLKKGIKIYSKKALSKLLEDYCS